MRWKLATVGLFAAALIVPFASADEAEDKAVAAIKKLGGKIERDEKGTGRPVVVVDLFDKRMTDAGLKDLAAFGQLQELYLSGTRITDTGLKEVAALKQLQKLYLSGTEITDAGLKDLAALKQLHTLGVRLTKATDAGAMELKKALPKLVIVR